MNILTYPARPISGGLLVDKPWQWTLPGDDWWFEPKANGWRVLIHVPSKTMWNRNGELSSIEREFDTPIAKLKERGVVWADCEALERRHNIGRGSLVLLDVLSHEDEEQLYCAPYLQRRCYIRECGYPLRISASNCGPNNLYHLSSFRLSGAGAYLADGTSSVSLVWDQMKQTNKMLGVPFWEGFVAKRAGSKYPIQTASPDIEFRGWVKRRFLP